MGVTSGSATQRSERGLEKQFYEPSGEVTHRVSSSRVKEGTNGLFNVYLRMSVFIACLFFLPPDHLSTFTAVFKFRKPPHFKDSIDTDEHRQH